MANTTKCLDIYGKYHEVPTASLNWRPAVYGIVIKNDSVLLLRAFSDKYALPGGGLDLGEEPEQGVVREVLEESGLTVIDPVLIDVQNSFFQSTHADNTSYHSILIYYSCDLVGGTISTKGFDPDEKKYANIAEWVPITKLNDIKLASTVDFRPYILDYVER